MSNVRRMVYDSLNEVMCEVGINIEIYDELELNRECGMDSMGMVTLVVLLEEKMEKDLDTYLAKIRNCKYVKDVVLLMETINKE